jgi:hypothetical protein
VTVEISVNWHFIGEDEDVFLSYGTSIVKDAATEDDSEAQADNELPFLGSVLPLSSSVLAPGLSMPVPAR